MKRNRVQAGNFTRRSNGYSGVAIIPSQDSKNDWDWPVETGHLQHTERAVLMRPISYTLSQPSGEEIVADHHETALLMNISSHGMLLMMEEAPETQQVMKVRVPTPTDVADTPTLAEVRWVRKMPFASHNNLYLVGLKFVI
jgi:hypothetical protein